MRRIVNKLLFFIFAVFSAFLLISCTKKESSSQEEVFGKEGYVYQVTKDHFEEIGQMKNIECLCWKDDRLFMLVNVIQKGITETSLEQKAILSCRQDGSDGKLITISPEILRTSDVIQTFSIDEEGNLRLLLFVFSEEKSYVKLLDEEGNLLDSYALETNSKDIYLDVNRNCFIARDGSACGINGNNLYVFRPDGKQAGIINGNMEMGNVEFVQLEDGSVYITQEDSKGRLQFVKLDLEECKITETISIDDNIDFHRIKLCAGTGTIVYFSIEDSAVYSFDFANNQLTKLFSWINVGAAMEQADALFFRNGNLYAANAYMDWDNPQDSGSELIIVGQTKDSDKKEKKKLKLACYYLDFLKDEVLAFNQENEDYYIEIMDYTNYNNEEKEMRLQMDLTAGNVPDIIDVYSLSVGNYAKKGLFTDLYTLMEQDREIHKEDLIDSVRKIVEQDGKLYYMGSAFMLHSLVGSKARFGNKESITFSEMEKLYKKMLPEEVFMYYISRQGFLGITMQGNLNRFLNWDTGLVQFDSEDFIQMLKFSKKFPNEEDINIGFMPNFTSDASALLRQDRLLLNEECFDSIDMIQFLQKVYSDGFTALGYPSVNGDNALKMSFNGMALAITEQCNDKAGAWEFVRRFFTYEYQLKSTYNQLIEKGIPVRKDVLEKELEYAMATEPYTDEDGTKVVPMKGIYSRGNLTMPKEPLSKEEADIVYSLIDRIDGFISSRSDDVWKKMEEILNEETAAYYAGDKTAKEVAEIIQKRVQIYVDEQS